MIPIGTSRLGFLASSACVETESKPIYAKNIIAAPASMPNRSAVAVRPAENGLAEQAHAPLAVGPERAPVARVDVKGADRDYECDNREFENDHGGVEPGALFDTKDQNNRYRRDYENSRQVEETARRARCMSPPDAAE